MADANKVKVTECGEDTLNERGPVMPFLVLETQGELYAVRWSMVREAGILSSHDVVTSGGRPHVVRGGVSLPICYLWELVGQNRPGREADETAVVFLEETGNRMALAPERILWKQEADLRRLPQWLRAAPAVAGVIALTSGVAVVVIEPFQTKEDECLCRQSREV